jgi:uncharacterized protein (TIGR02145 family)
MKIKYLLIILSALVFFQCDDSSTIPSKYIGNQEWMSENLSVTNFRNGDPIKEAKTDDEWILANKNKEAAWCYYNNDISNNAQFGKLYNWYAVIDKRGLAPEGFHIASQNDWKILADFLFPQAIVGFKMKSETGWKNNGAEDGNGSNNSGFNGFPGGCRGYTGEFRELGSTGFWWSSTVDNSEEDHAWLRILSYESRGLLEVSDKFGSGFSVRCVKD